MRTTNVQQVAWLYKSDGTYIPSRVLPKDTDWKTDQVKVIHGRNYYRVATNEWVLGDDTTVIS
ncbi:SLAP domain-containing protein [Bombilactobacillus folatiphilus]|uniref:SLAP domain-containing protein n=1 Tax=Bombilactobacillus folatiphilus TaxID=2923362 RepID=A0ABY4PBM9_9LACO|nr:SLAP domain-containing protein [Bombilactobacillus folatiphilus]